MGGYLPTARVTNTHPPHIAQIIPYLCSVSDTILTIDPNIKLIEQPSTIDSIFIDGRHIGLFTTKHIRKGTIISAALEKESMINDGIVDLTGILKAKTSVATYEAWTDLKNSYYDVEKIARVVNVRMVIDQRNKTYYEAIQDIPAGGELLRVYGFTTWPLELLDTLTNHNIAGFTRFIDELVEDLKGDPYEERIRKLQYALHRYERYVDNRITMLLDEYDEKIEGEKLINIGNNIKTLYIM